MFELDEYGGVGDLEVCWVSVDVKFWAGLVNGNDGKELLMDLKLERFERT